MVAEGATIEAVPLFRGEPPAALLPPVGHCLASCDGAGPRPAEDAEDEVLITAPRTAGPVLRHHVPAAAHDPGYWFAPGARDARRGPRDGPGGRRRGLGTAVAAHSTIEVPERRARS